MRYENRQPDEGINITRHSAFLLFLKLFVGLVILIVVVVVTLNFTGAAIARKVPFKYEVSLMNRLDVSFGQDQPAELIDYLSTLSTRLAEHMPVPQDMEFTLNYHADDVFNAFATVGGNLVFHRELLREMPHENALAMVVAHEMAHILHRDPLAGLGGGVASMVALMMLTGTSTFGNTVLNQTGMLTQLTFNREMEHAADRAALHAVAGMYGHVAGADTLFRLLSGRRGEGESREQAAERFTNWLSEFGSTHPLDQSRIDAIARLAQSNGWSQQGELTALPAQFKNWLAVKP